MRAIVLLLALGAFAGVNASPDDDARTNYLFGCRGCHLADGRGVPPEVPTLRETLGDIIARPGGRAYLVRVPGVLQSRLDDAELAEVLNYILIEFNAATLPENFKPYTPAEVTAARGDILPNPQEYRQALLDGSAPE